VNVLVVTTVHHPLDARIRNRQIDAMLRRGWQVTYVAPAGDGVPVGGLERVVVRRAERRRRLGALLDAARALRRASAQADVAIIHDPELLLIAWLARCPVVFDVHEDVSKQVVDKKWLPAFVKPLARSMARLFDRRINDMPLMVAEEPYLERHPSAVLVRNSFDFARLPAAPAPDLPRDRVVYLGAVTEPRGAHLLDAVAADLPAGVSMEVIGPVLPSLVGALPNLEAAGALRGRTSLAEGLERINGALAGLCLLQDRPNYRNSVPTKVLEYLACGIPVVATPLPHAKRILDESGAGIMVAFDDPSEVCSALERLQADPVAAQQMGERGREYARRYFDWADDEQRFIDLLEEVARGQHA
jgi:glycosyltransferase involved in cell wall biosynthesis